MQNSIFRRSYTMKNLVPILLLLTCISCSEKIRVYTDKDPNRDMRTFTSFQWEPVKDIETGKNPVYYNELNDKRIKTEVNSQLQNRGYELIEGEFQLIVHYHIVVSNETVSRDMTDYYHGERWLQADREPHTFREGTLIIDLMDAKTNALIWRGYAVSILDGRQPDVAGTKIREAITKIFLLFPHADN